MEQRVRYRRLAYVALNVTDIERSVAFYRDLVGLDLSERVGDEAAMFRCGWDHHNVILYRADKPGLKRAGFQLENEPQLDLLCAQLKAMGLPLEQVDRKESDALHQSRTVRVREPRSGLQLEFFVSMRHMALPFEQRLTKIARLGHVVIKVREFEQVLAFFTDTLGFEVSDYVPDAFAFLRCFPNPLHHSFALGKAPMDALHHVNFMVSDIDDVGMAMNRMKKAQVEIVFGPGRHQPSTSIFLYFLDPDRMTVEYSFGMEEFPEIDARLPRMLEPRPEALDTWGSVPAPAFAQAGEIEAPR